MCRLKTSHCVTTNFVIGLCTCFIFQFQGYAYDLGTPVSLNTAILSDIFITVIRNNFPPVFFNEPYSVQISETHAALTSVFQTQASDADTQVMEKG